MKKALIAVAAMLLATPLAPAAAQNWDATYAVTDGGHVLGNPAAATSLIAFISYSCPHCGNFEAQSEGPLRLAYVQPGRVKVEVRSVIRNPIDLAATLAVECGAESRFWANHRAMFRAQSRWLAAASAASATQQSRWTSGAFGARMRAIASDLDFYRVMEPRGYSRTQLDQCLNNETDARRIAESARADSARWNIAGTPSFVLNGTLLANVFDWAGLQRRLDAAGPARSR